MVAFGQLSCPFKSLQGNCYRNPTQLRFKHRTFWFETQCPDHQATANSQSWMQCEVCSRNNLSRAYLHSGILPPLAVCCVAVPATARSIVLCFPMQSWALAATSYLFNFFNITFGQQVQNLYGHVGLEAGQFCDLAWKQVNFGSRSILALKVPVNQLQYIPYTALSKCFCKFSPVCQLTNMLHPSYPHMLF